MVLLLLPATHPEIATFITAYAWPGPRFQPIYSPARGMLGREARADFTGTGTFTVIGMSTKIAIR
jgi:hypothetical protein